MYSIEPDKRRNRLKLSFSGQMQQDPPTFFNELKDGVQSIVSRTGDWDLVVDFTDTPVMPQDRAQNTARIFEWCETNGVRKIAFAVSSITQLMQIRRVTGRSPKVECFEDLEEAEFWLAL